MLPGNLQQKPCFTLQQSSVEIKPQENGQGHPCQVKMLSRVPQVQCRQLLAYPHLNPQKAKPSYFLFLHYLLQSQAPVHTVHCYQFIQKLLLYCHTFLESTSEFSLYLKIVTVVFKGNTKIFCYQWKLSKTADMDILLEKLCQYVSKRIKLLGFKMSGLKKLFVLKHIRALL